MAEMRSAFRICVERCDGNRTFWRPSVYIRR